MQVTIIPIVIGAVGTVTKGLLKSLEDVEVGRKEDTIETTVFLKTSLKSEKPTADADVKNS